EYSTALSRDLRHVRRSRESAVEYSRRHYPLLLRRGLQTNIRSTARRTPTYDPRPTTHDLIPTYDPRPTTHDLIPTYDPRPTTHDLISTYDPRPTTHDLISTYDPRP